MPTYKETVIEESKKRAGEILERIQAFRCQIDILERERDQISVVLRALGERNTARSASPPKARVINWGDEVRVELGYGHSHVCDRKLMTEIASLKKFRTAEAIAILVGSARYSGKPFDHRCVRYYLAALMDAGAIVRVERGQYEQPAFAPTGHLSDLVESE